MEAVVRNTDDPGLALDHLRGLGIIVITTAIISTVRTLRGAETPETEDPRQEAKIFAPAGFVPTPAEKELQARWASEVPERQERRAHH